MQDLTAAAQKRKLSNGLAQRVVQTVPFISTKWELLRDKHSGCYTKDHAVDPKTTLLYLPSSVLSHRIMASMGNVLRMVAFSRSAAISGSAGSHITVVQWFVSKWVLWASK